MIHVYQNVGIMQMLKVLKKNFISIIQFVTHISTNTSKKIIFISCNFITLISKSESKLNNSCN